MPSPFLLWLCHSGLSFHFFSISASISDNSLGEIRPSAVPATLLTLARSWSCSPLADDPGQCSGFGLMRSNELFSLPRYRAFTGVWLELGGVRDNPKPLMWGGEEGHTGARGLWWCLERLPVKRDTKGRLVWRSALRKQGATRWKCF